MYTPKPYVLNAVNHTSPGFHVLQLGFWVNDVYTEDFGWTVSNSEIDHKEVTKKDFGCKRFGVYNKQLGSYELMIGLNLANYSI